MFSKFNTLRIVAAGIMMITVLSACTPHFTRKFTPDAPIKFESWHINIKVRAYENSIWRRSLDNHNYYMITELDIGPEYEPTLYDANILSMSLKSGNCPGDTSYPMGTPKVTNYGAGQRGRGEMKSENSFPIEPTVETLCATTKVEFTHKNDKSVTEKIYTADLFRREYTRFWQVYD